MTGHFDCFMALLRLFHSFRPRQSNWWGKSGRPREKPGHPQTKQDFLTYCKPTFFVCILFSGYSRGGHFQNSLENVSLKVKAEGIEKWFKTETKAFSSVVLVRTEAAYCEFVQIT